MGGVIRAWAVSAGDVFTRISSASDLSDGDEIIFVNQAETYACGTTQNTYNRTPVSITVSDHTYTYSSKDNVQVFVVKINPGAGSAQDTYGFHTGSGYIYSGSSKDNHLKTNATASSTAPSGTAAWTLSVSSYIFSVTNVTNTSYYLAFNGTSYFSQYKTGQSKPYIFKKQATPTAEITMTTNDVNLAVGATETRTASSSTTGATISYSSSNSSVASVNASTGTVTAVSEGSATITATASADGYLNATASYTVNVSDARTAVNLSTFTATATTLIAGGSPSSTTTSVTNDQAGWTAAYTYSSSDEDVATVDGDGMITAVAKGTATITCLLNVDAEDEDYKAGTTASKTIDITVNNPSHTVTFSSNGSTYGEPAEVEDGESITFPAVNPSVDGKSFRGWVTAPILGTTNTTPNFVTQPVMGTSNVTYYAVFADVVAGDEVAQSLTIDADEHKTGFPTSYAAAQDYTLSGKKFNILQGYVNGTILQWRASGNSNGTGTIYNKDELSKLQSIVLTYGSSDTNKNFTLKIGDSANPTSGTSITPTSSGSVYTFDCSSYNNGYFVLTNGTGAGYLTSIVINYKTGSPDTYENYCTTVSDLPLAVVTLSADAIEMTWGESGKTLTATATVNDEELDETITFTSSSANLTIDGSGNISCDVPGDYTITASVAETAGHQAGQAICNVIVNKKDIELSFANETVNKMVTDEEYTQTATASPAAYDGDITYAITSSTSADALIDDNTGELLFENIGVIEVTATAAATTLYNGNTASYTLYVKTTPTIVVENQSVAYGSTFTVDDSMIEGGDITVTSGSAIIATADGLVLTPVAVGSTTITVSTAASDTYIAGEETFTLTVTAPTGASEKPSTEPVCVFYESFNDCAGIGEEDSFSGTGTVAIACDNAGWTNSGANAANKCAKYGSSKNAGSATTPSIAVTNGTVYTLTFKAAPWSDEITKMSVSVIGGTITGISDGNMTTQKWNNYTGTITANSTSLTITFAPSGNNRFFLDEVKLTKPGTPLTSTTVTTTGGLATYCYQYPLDLDGISGAKAYKVSDVDVANSKVKMEQITGTIKGGVPFILKSDGDDATFTIPLADESTTVPASNALVGTLAPTFVAQTSGNYTNFAYSKSNACFVKLSSDGNTVPANRAYLPINLDDAGVKAFTLFFDDTATGITETRTVTREEAEAIYNLAGQRLDHSRFTIHHSQMKRGIYVVGGKKVAIK